MQVVADGAKADLEEAMPALCAAIDSLKALNKNDITEIKSFAKPPALVQVRHVVVVHLWKKELQGRPCMEPTARVTRTH
jgi:dynein heavy chain